MNLDLSWSKFQPCLHQSLILSGFMKCCKTLFHSQLLLSLKIMPLKSPPPPLKLKFKMGAKFQVPTEYDKQTTLIAERVYQGNNH